MEKLNELGYPFNEDQGYHFHDAEGNVNKMSAFIAAVEKDSYGMIHALRNAGCNYKNDKGFRQTNGSTKKTSSPLVAAVEQRACNAIKAFGEIARDINEDKGRSVTRPGYSEQCSPLAVAATHNLAESIVALCQAGWDVHKDKGHVSQFSRHPLAQTEQMFKGEKISALAIAADRNASDAFKAIHQAGVNIKNDPGRVLTMQNGETQQCTALVVAAQKEAFDVIDAMHDAGHHHEQDSGVIQKNKRGQVLSKTSVSDCVHEGGYGARVIVALQRHRPFEGMFRQTDVVPGESFTEGLTRVHGVTIGTFVDQLTGARGQPRGCSIC